MYKSDNCEDGRDKLGDAVKCGQADIDRKQETDTDGALPAEIPLTRVLRPEVCISASLGVLFQVSRVNQSRCQLHAAGDGSVSDLLDLKHRHTCREGYILLWRSVWSPYDRLVHE